VVLTSPATSIDEDVEFVEEARRVRPGIRAIALATESSPAR